MPQMTDINYEMLPERLRGGMRRWIEHGIVPGYFLEAVLSNDLVRAITAADATNLAAMREIAVFMYQEAPAGCWRTNERIRVWAAKGGLLGAQPGTEARDADEKD